MAFARADAFAAWEPDRRHAAWEALRACGDVLPLAPATVSSHDPVPIDREQLVFLDYHAVGMSIHGHPMESVRARLKRGGAIDSRQLMQMPNGRTVTVGGLVTVRQRPATAGGTIFLLLEDEHGYVNVVVSKAARRAERGGREAGAVRARAGPRGERRGGDLGRGQAVQGAGGRAPSRTARTSFDE